MICSPNFQLNARIKSASMAPIKYQTNPFIFFVFHQSAYSHSFTQHASSGKRLLVHSTHFKPTSEKYTWYLIPILYIGSFLTMMPGLCVIPGILGFFKNTISPIFILSPHFLSLWCTKTCYSANKLWQNLNYLLLEWDQYRSHPASTCLALWVWLNHLSSFVTDLTKINLCFATT